MKIAIYAAREDEKNYIEKYSQKFGFELSVFHFDLKSETVESSKGHIGVIVIGSSNINREVLNKLKEYGIKFISSRSIGFNNIDIDYAEKIGIKVSNALYSPNSVSEYVVMYSIMLSRNIPTIFEKMENNDFSLKGVIGRELKNQTFGIIGTGRIGSTLAKNLKGLVKEIIAYDIYENKSITDIVKYVSFDEILEKSDIISLHLPLTKENYHIINSENICKMKDNVIIINTARGELIDTKAILNGIKSKKIGGVAFDVLENEKNIFNNKADKENSDFIIYKKLSEFSNVIITPHTAFYTEEAVHDMVYSSFLNMHSYITTGTAPNNLTK